MGRQYPLLKSVTCLNLYLGLAFLLVAALFVNRISPHLSAWLLVGLAGLYAGQVWLARRLIVGPVTRMREAAIQIATDSNRVGEAIPFPFPFGREFRELAAAFNMMSISLRQHRDRLEDRIRERSLELQRATERGQEDIAERRRAEAALLSRTRQIEAARAVSTEITRELNLATLLGSIHRRAAELVNATSGSVSLWDESEQVLVPQTWHGYGDWRGAIRLRLGQGVAGTVAERREGLIVNDYRTSPYATPEFLERTGIHTVLAEPLLFQDRLIGVITVSNEDPRRTFSQQDRETLALFAAQAAIAIENARLYEAAQRDVAERALAEEVLAQERNLLRTLIDNVPDRIYIKDAQGRYLMDNAAHRHCLRAPGLDAVIGKTIFDFYPREAAEPSDRADRAVLASGEKVVNQEEVFVDRDTGELDWDLTTKVPLRDSHGTVIGLVSIGRTITERKRAEEALADRTRQLEAVRAVTEEITRELDLHTLLGLIARHTRDLVQATSITINLWDDEAQVLVPQTWLGFDAWRGEVRLRLGEGVAGTVAERREGLIVNEFRTSPYALPIFLERTTYTAVLAEPLLYRSRLIGVLAVAREQTGPPFTETDRQLLALFATQAAIAIENAQLYREVQDHAEILERRVAERTQALKEAQAELVQSAKLAAVGMLAAGVAHELNQPLTIIRGYAQHLVTEGGLPEEAKAALDHIQAQSERMATIVNHLRDFSRQTKGTYESVALNEVVAAAFLMLRQQLRIRKIKVVQALEPALPAIWGDRFQLEQVFINLITNARDAVQSQGGGRLTVTSRAVGDWVEVAVADTGPGVPVDLQERIFEPFFTTKEVGDGTGLGLSISYGIIREHGGEIRVANRPEGGAEFVVRLPVRSPAQPGGNAADAQSGP